MEENKTNEALVPETIEAETATVAPAETTEETAAPEVSESVNDAEENLKPMATAEDEVTVLVLPDTKQGVIERLREIAQTGGNVARGELEALKQVYYRLHNAEAAAARDAFVAAGGAIEEYVPEPDMDESSFKAEMALIRELRAKALEAAEQEKQKNLSRKLEIIDDVLNDLSLRSPGKREFERSFNCFDPWNVSIKIYERTVGISSEETCSRLKPNLVSRKVPVGVFL